MSAYVIHMDRTFRELTPAEKREFEAQRIFTVPVRADRQSPRSLGIPIGERTAQERTKRLTPCPETAGESVTPAAVNTFATRGVERAEQLPAACADAGENLADAGGVCKSAHNGGRHPEIPHKPASAFPIHTPSRLLGWLVAITFYVTAGCAFGLLLTRYFAE